MQIGSVITAPTQPAFRTPTLRRMSSLNPLRDTRARASTQTLTRPDSDEKTNCSFRNRIQTQTHLSNLNQLLQKGPPTPLPDTPKADLFKLYPENRGKGTFDGFNLAGIWPASKKAEEMSPRHLYKLQRLLTKSPEYSPRNILSRRWKEYHGSHNWDKLLDPLDENLRREVVRYGEFVQAAYQAFHSNPATSESDLTSSRHVALPDRSYKVTKSLYATSSVGLPGWVDDVAPDLGWMTQRSSWIGYVAVCDDEREIARMGRRDIVIALRGTATCLEWAENFRAKLVGIPADADQSEGADPMVECGFWSLYKTPGTHFASLSAAIIEEVRRLLDQYEGEDLSISVTGHSLGAALALLAANELSTCAPQVPPIAVFSFGGPRVGNRAFGDAVNRNGVKVLRIVNAQDVITRVPAVPHVPDDAQWAYSHVGSELRVDSRSSPYLKPNADVACCHDLEAYLHLVDGFLASNRPFRSNAKRSLVRLLHDQGSNMKKLYIKKGLKLNLEGMRTVTPSCMPSPS